MPTKQNATDKAWGLYNNALDALEELELFLDNLEDEHGLDVSKAQRAAGTAHSALDTAYSTGSAILPPHSSEVGA